MTSKKTLWLASGVIFACLTLANSAHSQITPDGTTNTKVDNDCLNSCDITGGTLAGENLFHSFQQFNVDARESVYFADPNVANIFSRVTGGDLSRIFGKLGVSGGDANLFLLNPNGIIFGAGAELDLNGSFVATTADEIKFGDRGLLTATPDSTENLALLTVNPSAFFFNQMGQPNPITTQSGAKLSVPQQQNITLLGGQPGEDVGILLRGATLQAPEGQVSLGAVKESASVEIDADWQLQFADEVMKGDITLTQGSAIDVSGVGSGSVDLQGDRVNLAQKSRIVADTLGDIEGGDISIQANNLTVQENSFISASTRGMGNGGNIRIFADEGMEVAGANVAALQQFIGTSLAGGEPERDLSSTVHTATYGSGASGDIKIKTQQLQINNGAWIISSTVDRGNGGNIAIEADNSTAINGSGIFTGSSARGSGIPGNLTIDTQNLLLQNSGVVSSSTLGQSAGGNLAITATESVRLQQTLPGTIIPTGIYSNTILGSGKAGNLTIDTQKLIVEDGSQLSSASGLITNEIFLPLGGNGGDISINATESVEISGKSEDGNFFSSIVNDTRSNNPAGDLKIDTGSLIVRDDGLISASSIRSGNGGNVTLNASESVELFGSGTGALQQIILDGLAGQLNITEVTGGIFSITVAGEAGNIAINAPKLTLSEGAIVSTASLGQGTAGDLLIEASEKINVIGSAIASPTLGSGDAGKITIDTSHLILREGGLIATATLTEGDAGDLFINASKSIELLDTSSGLLFSGTISSGSYGGQGLVGDLTIDTQNLVIKNGAGIDSTSTIFPGLPMVDREPTTSQGANLTINASESIAISGSSPVDNAGSRISSTTTTAAPASNINLNTNHLAVFDGGEIAVDSAGEGAAGSLSVMANSIDLENGGNFNATTSSGKGGNISLELRDILQLNNRALITTNATGEGNGGNISIAADFAIISKNSNITAQAIAGQGGNIDIKAQDIFITSNSDISASSALGIDGEVNIQTFTNIQRNNLSQLPETLIAVDQNVVQKCSNNSNSQGVFSYVGRGGLPPNPLGDRFSDNSVIADLDIPNGRNTTSELFTPETFSHDFSLQETNTTNEVIEAQGWFRNDAGKVILTAQGDRGDRSNSEFGLDACPFKGY